MECSEKYDWVSRFDSRLGKWVLVDTYEEENNIIWLRGIGKIYFPINPGYEIINPMYCLKGDNNEH